MHDDALAGIRPVTNTSDITRRDTSPGLSHEVATAAVEGRTLIAPGSPGSDVQAILNTVADVAKQLEALGPRPVATGSLPSITDARTPFNGDTLTGTLVRHGLTQNEAHDAGPRLRDLVPVLPAMLRQVREATPGNRAVVYRACLATLAEITTIVEGWADSVEQSALSDAAQHAYDNQRRVLTTNAAQAREQLKVLSQERVDGYLTAIATARADAKAEAAQARIAELEAMILTAAKKPSKSAE